MLSNSYYYGRITGVTLGLVINFDLQVLGVTSIWAYSEILEQRHNSTINNNVSGWKTLTNSFMLFALIRFSILQIAAITNNDKISLFANAMENPPKAIAGFYQPSTREAQGVITIAIGLGIISDFILQVLGTAAWWGFSESTGLRENGGNYSTNNWAKLSIIFSVISLIRYGCRIAN